MRISEQAKENSFILPSWYHTTNGHTKRLVSLQLIRKVKERYFKGLLSKAFWYDLSKKGSSFTDCNKRLVAETKGKLTNIGIIAHIIGHKGPRYEYASEFDYTDDTLEDISNLMLMCYDHSKLIDEKHTRDQFPPNRLFEMKTKHEAWVRSWVDERKKSLAIIHKRLGPPMITIPQIEVSPNILL